jgi:hypothetical protein
LCGKDRSEQNKIVELEFNNSKTTQLISHTNLSINKIVKNENGNFILTSRGIYSDINKKINFGNEIIDNNNIVDLFINGLKWIMVS